MDIYRFFHPHHNPRLHRTALRQQELGELSQAASELRKALERARKRTENNAAPPILPQHFDDVMKAIRFVENSMQTLFDAHEGDAEFDIKEMIRERAEFPGWNTWASLVREQVDFTEAGQWQDSIRGNGTDDTLS